MVAVHVKVFDYTDASAIQIKVYNVDFVWMRPWPNWDYEWVKTLGDLIGSYGVDANGMLTFDLTLGEYWMECREGERIDGPRLFAITREDYLYFHIPPEYPSPEQGTILVATKPKAPVYINGVPWGWTPFILTRSIGNYTISFGEILGYATPPTQTVTVTHEVVTPVIAEYTSKPSTLALALAPMIVGIILTVVATKG